MKSRIRLILAAALLACAGCGTVREALNDVHRSLIRVVDAAESAQTNLVKSATGLTQTSDSK